MLTKKESKLTKKESKALLFAVLAPVCFAVIVVLGFFLSGGRDYDSATLSVAFFVTIYVATIGTFISAGGGVIVGLPIHFLFKKNGIRSWWSYVGCSIVVGIGCAVLYFIFLDGNGGLDGLTDFVTLTGKFFLFNILLGPPIAACTFWCVARPDRLIEGNA
ncbi:MAG: hypothetical protein KGH70_03810 [Rhodospirillales bacterium]|nr:hypothetical protein [Rhodospirillales bacterium]